MKLLSKIRNFYFTWKIQRWLFKTLNKKEKVKDVRIENEWVNGVFESRVVIDLVPQEKIMTNINSITDSIKWRTE